VGGLSAIHALAHAHAEYMSVLLSDFVRQLLLLLMLLLVV